MKLNVIDESKKKVGDIDLPAQFGEEYRPDLIHQAVLTIQSHKRQPYGATPQAGKRVSAKLSRRRRKYRGSYGIGISRVPRKIMTRRGTRLNWVGAFAPGTVGGRRAHPPKSSKIFKKKINEKERIKALRSAISATVLKDVVKERGHTVPKEYPFVLNDSFESLDKTKKVVDIFNNLGLKEELLRSTVKKVRAGKGKSRGRKYNKRTSLLVVVSKPNKLSKAALNIPGVDIVEARSLNTELLAPGGIPGRLTLWTSAAIKQIEKENLFKYKSK
jgi:large subunit ribosomal protein L4e